MGLDQLLAVGDDQHHLRRSGGHGLLDRPFDNRAVDDRQHLLGENLGGWQEARAQPGGGDHAVSDRVHRSGIVPICGPAPQREAPPPAPSTTIRTPCSTFVRTSSEPSAPFWPNGGSRRRWRPSSTPRPARSSGISPPPCPCAPPEPSAARPWTSPGSCGSASRRSTCRSPARGRRAPPATSTAASTRPCGLRRSSSRP